MYLEVIRASQIAYKAYSRKTHVSFWQTFHALFLKYLFIEGSAEGTISEYLLKWTIEVNLFPDFKKNNRVNSLSHTQDAIRIYRVDAQWKLRDKFCLILKLTIQFQVSMACALSQLLSYSQQAMRSVFRITVTTSSVIAYIPVIVKMRQVKK